ncbi:MAG TPA: type I phosphomannose isomerase catalytic subunit, partial [Anaerolineae bacterium]|nr:type I phosphomannose isomerase catalytic subunit [Anaerolineae bacterium]
MKDYIWGGRNLERLGRQLPSGITAESWDIAAHQNGTTMVDNGHYAGKLLTEVQQELGLDLIGRNSSWAQDRGKFPLLVKLLDANRPLSVQVHPNDDYAMANEGNELGKSEMWVVLHAEPDARLILGVKPGTSRASFRQAILDGRLEPLLHSFPAKTDDYICVPAGSLHAIMGGLIIAEIQQNSDTTYRVYDWNRLGSDGRPRPLHVEKALDVINFQQVEPGLSPAMLVAEDSGISRYLLCKNRYFVTERLEMAQGSTFNGECDGDSLEIWGVLDGSAQIG